MSEIILFSDKDSSKPLSKSMDRGHIQQLLAEVGVSFEQWRADKNVVAGDSQEDIIDTYREDIDRLMAENGYRSVDVVSLTADQPEKEILRQKFLAEHTHSENEVRFFVDGQGLFSLHINDRVYEILCEKGDHQKQQAGGSDVWSRSTRCCHGGRRLC